VEGKTRDRKRKKRRREREGGKETGEKEAEIYRTKS